MEGDREQHNPHNPPPGIRRGRRIGEVGRQQRGDLDLQQMIEAAEARREDVKEPVEDEVSAEMNRQQSRGIANRYNQSALINMRKRMGADMVRGINVRGKIPAYHQLPKKYHPKTRSKESKVNLKPRKKIGSSKQGKRREKKRL